MQIGKQHEADVVARGWLQAALPQSAGSAAESSGVQGQADSGVSSSSSSSRDMQPNTLDSSRFSGQAVVNHLGVPSMERGDNAGGYGRDGKANSESQNHNATNEQTTPQGPPRLRVKMVSVPHEEGSLPASGVTPRIGAAEKSSDLTGLSGVADEDAEDAAADKRTVDKLRAREQQVKDRESAKGEAVAGENYTYQTGPDGKQYAIGTGSHLVRKDEDAMQGMPDGVGTVSGPTIGKDEKDLAPEERQNLDRLKARDQEVRAHEQEHMTAASGQAQGGPEFTYQTGPDGQRYAVGGSVHMGLESTPGDPEATRKEAQNIQSAALAPGSPSGQDYMVAAKAGRIESQAEQEVASKNTTQRSALVSRALSAYSEQPEAQAMLQAVA